MMLDTMLLIVKSEHPSSLSACIAEMRLTGFTYGGTTRQVS